MTQLETVVYGRFIINIVQNPTKKVKNEKIELVKKLSNALNSSKTKKQNETVILDVIFYNQFVNC